MFHTNDFCTIPVVVSMLQSLELHQESLGTKGRWPENNTNLLLQCKPSPAVSVPKIPEKERTFLGGPTLVVHTLKTKDFAPKKNKISYLEEG